MFRVLLHRAFIEPTASIQRIDKTDVGSKAILCVDGLLCSLCAANVNGRLEAVEGVQSANVDLEEGVAVIRYDGERVGADELMAAVEAAIVLKPIRRLLAQLGGRGA